MSTENFRNSDRDEPALMSLAHRLEAILEDLDDLGMQRVAIDVCLALERVKARIADCGPGPHEGNASA